MIEKDGFTLIELLSVISILGILILIAFPSHNDRVNETQIAQITSDIRKYETRIEFESVKKVSFKEDNFRKVDSIQYLFENGGENIIYFEQGLLKDPIVGDLWEVDRENVSVESSLKGIFLIDSIGNVYYLDKT